jgi:dihydroorotase-like cyclic amidohydrolase
MITFPGLIDPHTHPRGLPTDDYKEDFYTATCAAIAGGFTTILDMPNNPQTPTLTYNLMFEKQRLAKQKMICDIGFFFGTNGKNLEEFQKIQIISVGLKVFLSHSTGNLIVDNETFRKVCEKWTSKLPLLLHAEEEVIEEALEVIHKTGHQAHICHVSSEEELTKIIEYKNKGMSITCGVTPHHLFLTKDDEAKLGPYGLMKPSLKTKKDQDFLWKNLQFIDVIESDHAPHTKDEKESNNPPYGVPGLETTLPLLLTAMNEGKITKEEIIDKCYIRVKEIFHVSGQPDTHVEVDEDEEWEIQNDKLYTKCKWSPFNGRQVRGSVKRVVIRGTNVFEDGKILVKPGFGEIIT